MVGLRKTLKALERSVAAVFTGDLVSLCRHSIASVGECERYLKKLELISRRLLGGLGRIPSKPLPDFISSASEVTAWCLVEFTHLFAIFSSAITRSSLSALRALHMGTPRKAAKKIDPPKAVEMSDQRDTAQSASSQDRATVDASDYAIPGISKVIFPLTDECQHYTHVSQVDWDIQK